MTVGDGVFSYDETTSITHAQLSEAVAALHSGDAAGFARAMGIEHPSEAFLQAANAKGSPFDPEASGPWQSGPIAAAAMG